MTIENKTFYFQDDFISKYESNLDKHKDSAICWNSFDNFHIIQELYSITSIEKKLFNLGNLDFN